MFPVFTISSKVNLLFFPWKSAGSVFLISPILFSEIFSTVLEAKTFVDSKLTDLLLPLLLAPPAPSTIPLSPLPPVAVSPKSANVNPDIPFATEYTSSNAPCVTAFPPVKFASPEIYPLFFIELIFLSTSLLLL